MPIRWSITQIWVKPSGIPQIWVNPQIWAITQNWENHAQITQNWVLHLFLRVVIYLSKTVVQKLLNQNITLFIREMPLKMSIRRPFYLGLNVLMSFVPHVWQGSDHGPRGRDWVTYRDWLTNLDDWWRFDSIRFDETGCHVKLTWATARPG